MRIAALVRTDKVAFFQVALLWFDDGGGVTEGASVEKRVKKSTATTKNAQDQCIHEKFQYEVTFQGGINAGNFIDQGKFLSESQCLDKCCQSNLCDAAFMLNNSCYSVTCSTIVSCTLQKAKPSQLNPKIAFVTRWNSEGVRRTLFGDDRQLPWQNNTCPKMTPLHDVTLKNGLEAGVFTDSGKTDSLEDCYNVCCQRFDCNMAFLLADNCFTIKCHKTVPATINMNKVQVCETDKAAASTFNPKAAHVYSRVLANNQDSTSGYLLYYPTDKTSPTTAPTYNPYENKEWQPPNQPTEPFYNNQYQYQAPTIPQSPSFQPSTLPVTNQIDANYGKQFSFPNNENFLALASSPPPTPKDNPYASTGNIKDAMDKYSGFMFSPNIGFMPLNDLNNFTENLPPTYPNNGGGASNSECPLTRIFDKSFLRDKQNAGLFEETPASVTNNIFLCQQFCCQDNKCDVVVMVDNKCYKVQCKSIDSCTLEHNPPPAEANLMVNGWQIMYVRNAQTKAILKDSSEVQVYQGAAPTKAYYGELPSPSSSGNNVTKQLNQEPPTPAKSDYYAFRNMPSTENTLAQPGIEPAPVDTTTTTVSIHKQDLCETKEVHKDSTVVGGKEAGTMVKLAENSNIETCAMLCCSTPIITSGSENKTCHVALLIDSECYGISCNSKELCAVTKDKSKITTKSLVIVRNITHATSSSTTSVSIGKNISSDSEPNTEATKDQTHHPETHTEPTTTTTSTTTSTVGSDGDDNGSFNLHQNCYHETITKNKTLVAVAMIKNSFSVSTEGIHKAIKELASGVNTMERCVQLCCDNHPCEAAVLQQKRCISIECSTSPSLCKTTTNPNHHDDEHPQVSIVKRNTIPLEGNKLSSSDSRLKNKDVWILIGAGGLGVVVMAFAIFSVAFYRRNYLQKKTKTKKHAKLPRILETHQQRRPSSIFPTEENILEELLSKASKSRHIKPSSMKHYKK